MTETRLRLIPECHADTALMVFLAGPTIAVDHAPSISQVATEMQNTKKQDFVLIGVVDNDKKKPTYFNDFQEIERGQRVSFRHKANTNQYLIVLEKALETFLLHNATVVGLNMTDFDFSDNLKDFGHQLKRMNIGSNTNYQKLLAELYQKQAPDLVKITDFLLGFVNTEK